MLRNPSLIDGMLQWGRGLAVEKRQAPVIEIAMAGTTPPPRNKEGTHPGRLSRVRNAETPTESGPLRRPGRPTVRNGGILLAGTGCPRNECRGGEDDRENATPRRAPPINRAGETGRDPARGGGAPKGG